MKRVLTDSFSIILDNGSLFHILLTLLQQGSVNNQSIFQYDDGMTFKDFSHPEFVPFFSDEVGKDRFNDAETMCGDNPSLSCVSDYLATGDITLASASGKAEETSKMNVKVLGNLWN